MNYLLVLLNSNITSWIFKRLSPHILAQRLRFTKQYVGKIPILLTTEENKKELINLSKELQKLYSNFKNTKTPNERKLIQKQIDLTDHKINELIYQLYDLTDDEIKIIEENI